MFSLNTLKTTTLSALLLFGSALLLSISQSAARADTETNIHDFGGSDGVNPVGSLVTAGDGTFYGVTATGGSAGLGCVFKITESGTETVLHSFGSGTPQSDGLEPFAGVIVGSDGNLYGTTSGGGANSLGTVYKITPAGVVTILHSFAGTTDGAIPETPLTFGKDGRLYGCTPADYEYENDGDETVFSLNTDGSGYLVQYQFPSGDHGAGILALAPGTSTTLYGTIGGMGENNSEGYGQLYSLTPGTTDGSAVVKVLHSFSNGSVADDGMVPNGALIARFCWRHLRNDLWGWRERHRNGVSIRVNRRVRGPLLVRRSELRSGRRTDCRQRRQLLRNDRTVRRRLPECRDGSPVSRRPAQFNDMLTTSDDDKANDGGATPDAPSYGRQRTATCSAPTYFDNGGPAAIKATW